MFRAAQADALGPEAARGAGVQRGLGVGADLQAANLVGPAHQGLEVAGQFGLDHVDGPVEDLALRAVDGDHLAGPEGATAGREGAGALIDRDFPGPRDAGPAHAARHHGGVAGHAAARGDDAPGGMHAADVLGAGFLAHQDDGVAQLAHALGLVGVEHDLAGGGPGRGRQAGGDDMTDGVRVQGRMQQLVEGGRIDPADGLVATDDPLGRQIDGDLQGRLAGALAVTGLQHPEAALFDRELDVLHVAIVGLELADDPDEFGEHRRHRLLHRQGRLAHLLAARPGQGLGRTDAGDDVLALGVDQEFAVQPGLAGRRIAGEGHAGGRGLAHIAEHHRLDVDGGAPALGDVMHAAIEFGAFVHPAVEHRRDRAPQLVLRILREGMAQPVLDHSLVFGDDLFPVAGAQVGVDGDAETVLVVVQDLLEVVMAQTQHDVRIHGDEAAIAVEGEAAVAGQGGQALDGFIVEAEIQDRVHHPGHRGAGPGANADQQGVGGVPEGLAGDLLDLLQSRPDLSGQGVGIGLALAEIVDAGLGGDGEARRHRQAQRGHLGEVGPLATEKVLHR